MSLPRSIEAPMSDRRVEAWTESTIGALDRLQVATPATAILSTSPRARGTGVTVDIPLDAEDPARRELPTSAEGKSQGHRVEHLHRREPHRRDSMKRREALLKGNEGSRRRQKWENDHLLGNPWFAPPAPSDYEIRPTHPVRNIPYFLAPLWDERAAQRSEQAREQQVRASKERTRAGPDVSRTLRATMKRSKGAKTLLQDLEEQVRAFVASQRAKEAINSSAIDDEDDDDDFDKLDSEESEDEVVFVGRRGEQTRDMKVPRSPRTQRQDKMVFDSPADDRGGTFGRYLVHELASYYDLHAWSITTGDPARREAYVGLKSFPGRSSLSDDPPASRIILGGQALPRPLWGEV